MIKSLASVSICLAVLTIGAAHLAHAQEKPAPPLEQLEGVWRSADYGEVFVVNPAGVAAYELAGDSCVKLDSEDEDLTSYFDIYKVSADRRSLYLSSAEEPYPYRFSRDDTLSTACLSPTEDTVMGNFQVFADSFSTFYPFFELYDVNWTSRVQTAQAQLRSDMTDTELFQIFKSMLKDVDDAHIEITAEVDGDRKVFKGNLGKTELALFERTAAAGQNPFRVRSEYRQKYWVNDLKDTLHEGKGTITGDGSIQYGLVSGDIGMISLLTMGGYIEEEGQTESAVLNAALDAAIREFKQNGVKAVIVNLAMNYGGYDYISRALAERFTDAPVKAYTKWSAQDPAGTRFEYEIKPAHGERFTGAVYLLTSDVTVSAGEIATMSLRALPNVTHAGEKTRGALSDVLSKTLPNGWELSLSSEVYEDHRGVQWEAKGIAPDIPVKVFNQDDPKNGFLEAVEALVALIDERHG